MRVSAILGFAGLLAIGVATSGLAAVSQASGGTGASEAEQLIGVWGAERDFSTRVEGPLRIREVGGALEASIAGLRAPVETDGTSVSVELPHGRGGFRGSFSQDRSTIAGHWIQPRGVVESSPFATPVRLVATAAGGWEGEVRPFQERFGMYVRFAKEDDGHVSVILRNPERNAGIFIRANRVEVEGERVTLLNGQGAPVLSGVLNDDGDVLSFPIPGAGTFDFTRRERHDAQGWYPRDDPSPYTYAPPLDDVDGWQIGHASDVGMSTESIEAFVQDILDTETTSYRTPYIQGLVIARKGKLILEEHFYGFHTDAAHDLRSAGKSITSMMVGQAIAEGAFDVRTKVYPMFPLSVANPDPRKADLSIEHLLTMNSGYDCDDNDYETPGNEDRMQSQSEQPDWLRYTLDLPLVRAPGESGVYCTGAINLLGGIVSEATGEWLPEFFRTRLAEPLGIEHYHMNLDPLDRGYAGGGLRLRPRDFLKFGQTMLDGGRWNGEQVLAETWVASSLTPRARVNGQDYGYAWWRTAHEVDGRTFESWSATGNGGQLLILVPEFELVVAFNGGSYGDFRTWISWRDELLPSFILEAVEN